MTKRPLENADDLFHIRKFNFRILPSDIRDYDWDFTGLVLGNDVPCCLSDDLVNKLNNIEDDEYKDIREKMVSLFTLGVSDLVESDILYHVCVWRGSTVIPEAVLWYCNWNVAKSILFYVRNLLLNYELLYKFTHESATNIIKRICNRNKILFNIDKESGIQLFRRMHTAKQFMSIYYALLNSYFPHRYVLDNDEREVLYSKVILLYKQCNFKMACNYFLRTVSYLSFYTNNNDDLFDLLLPPERICVVRQRQERFIRAVSEIPKEIKKSHSEITPRVYFNII
jgi:hypothetical protein